MVAARCVECGGGTIIRNGTAVIQHKDPECPAASDFEPIANMTTSIRDILVPTTWDELVNVVSAVHNAAPDKYVTVHLTVGYNSPAMGGSCVVEVRGNLYNILDGERPVLQFSSGTEVWAYKRDPDTEKPELDTAIPIGMLWGMGKVDLQINVLEIFEIQLIHQPSRHAPVTIASRHS